MEPRRDMGLLPIPEHRRRRIPVLAAIGLIALVAGWILGIGFVWGLGVGLLIAAVIALILDRMARRKAAG